MTHYDAFVAHAPADEPHAWRLADLLVDAGLRVFLLGWLEPGVVEYAAKETALLASANGILVFSHAAMADPAIRDDYATLLWRVHHGGRRFVPVVVDDVPLPPFAAIRRPFDLRDGAAAEPGIAALIRALRPADAPPTGPERVETRLGFTIDIVAYSSRSAPAMEEAQRRLARLTDEVLADLAVDATAVAHQSTGDGMNLFLPATIEVHRTLPLLLRSWRDRLSADNERSADRIRLRLAAAVGPVGRSAMGFSGRTIVELSRLVDSLPLRAHITGQPGRDLAVVLSNRLYEDAAGYVGVEPSAFCRCQVRVKGYDSIAWLWIGDAATHEERVPGNTPGP